METCWFSQILHLYLYSWRHTPYQLHFCRFSCQLFSGKIFQKYNILIVNINKYIQTRLLRTNRRWLYLLFYIPSRANISAAAGGLLFFATYLPYQFLRIWDDEINDSIRMGCVSIAHLLDLEQLNNRICDNLFKNL